MKVKLCILKKDNMNQKDSEFHSLMDIHKKYPQYSYHMLRQIYLQSCGKEIRKLHPNTQKLYDSIRIYDVQKEFA